MNISKYNLTSGIGTSANLNNSSNSLEQFNHIRESIENIEDKKSELNSKYVDKNLSEYDNVIFDLDSGLYYNKITGEVNDSKGKKIEGEEAQEVVKKYNRRDLKTEEEAMKKFIQTWQYPEDTFKDYIDLNVFLSNKEKYSDLEIKAVNNIQKLLGNDIKLYLKDYIIQDIGILGEIKAYSKEKGIFSFSFNGNLINIHSILNETPEGFKIFQYNKFDQDFNLINGGIQTIEFDKKTNYAELVKTELVREGKIFSTDEKEKAVNISKIKNYSETYYDFLHNTIYKKNPLYTPELFNVKLNNKKFIKKMFMATYTATIRIK